MADPASDMPFLPSFFVITNGAGFGLTVGNPPNVPSGMIRNEYQPVWSPRAKFATEPSKTRDSSLVHIRSCYNNKYWVSRDGQVSGTDWITASADEPEEDESNPECTLFRVEKEHNSLVQGRPTFRFFCISKTPRGVLHYYGRDGNFGLATLSNVAYQNFGIIDWQLLLILPSQVSFISEQLKDHYLCSRVLDRHYNYHRFESGLDIGNLLVAHELFRVNENQFRIRNLHFNRFWRLGTRWIWADAADNNHNSEVTFAFVKINDNVIAIRNLGNNLFCAPDSREGKVNCLRAEHATIIDRTRLIVAERVLKREITNVQYRFSDVRVYDEGLVEVSHAFSTNNTANPSVMVFSLTQTESLSTYWSNSISVNVNVNSELKVTPIPLVVEGTLKWSVDLNYDYEWREEKTTTTSKTVYHFDIVPPGATVKVTLLCTKAACDVPFNYTQRDLLPSGQWFPTVKDDGIYKGFNTDNFHFYSEEVK